MKQLLILSLFAFNLLSLKAQVSIVDTVSALIKQKQFDAALRYTDWELKKKPNNVDALIMKGNVILNRDILALPLPQIFTANDESIFNEDFNPAFESRKIVPATTVAEIEKLWLKCVALDSTRVEVQKGLCTVYAMALMEEKLKPAMVKLMQMEKDDGEQPFRMSEYARKFKERGEFDRAMQVYRFIASQYPATAGVRCDMASEYYYEGRINEALLWLDSTYNFKTVDETSFLNGAFIYSELGYYDDAQNVLNTYSRIYQRKMDKFYYGLRLFADTAPTYYNVLKEFIETVDSNAYYTEVRLAQQLLLFKNGMSLNDYRTTVQQDIPGFYIALIHQHVLKRFGARCEPALLYGIMQNSIRNYAASVQFLEGGNNCQMDVRQTETWMLNYGFALYQAKQPDEALLYFKNLFASADAFTAQAAKYFTSKILINQRKMPEGQVLLKEIVAGKQTTKYAVLADYVLGLMK